MTSHEYTSPIEIGNLGQYIDLESIKHLSYQKRDPIEIVYELEQTSSKNEKIEILKKALDQNAAFRLGVSLAYDHRIVFGQKKIPDHNPLNQRAEPLNMTLQRLQALYEREVTGNAAIDLLKQILEQSDPFGSLFVKLVVLKDLRCGINVGLINNAVKGFIPVQPCLKASAMDIENLKSWPYPTIAQIKMDGTRATFEIDVDRQRVRCFMRSGKQLEQIPQNILKCMLDGSPKIKALRSKFMADGELLVLEEGSDYQFLPRKRGNGIINKCIKGTATQDELKRIRFCVWDFIPASDFWEGKYEIPYAQRFNIVKSFVSACRTVQLDAPSNFFNDDIESIPCPIFVVESVQIDSFNQAMSYFESVVASGREGLIIKQEESIWANKRSPKHMKLKVENEIELIVRDVIEGTGKYVGKLGAFVCVSEDGSIACEVGTGFSDQDRQDFWQNPPIDKVVTLKYNEIITSEGRDTKSLFLPVFVEIREDLS